MKIYLADYGIGYFISDYDSCIEHARYELDWGSDASISVYCLEIGKGQISLVATVVAGGVKKFDDPPAAEFNYRF